MSAVLRETGAQDAARPRRVLLVEVNEDHTVGGSYQAQFDLARLLDRREFEPVVMFYQENIFAQRLRELGIEVHLFEAQRERERRINETAGRLRRLMKMGGAVVSRRDFLRHHRIDLLHLNNHPSLTCDDWLPAARLAGVPCIVNAMGEAPLEGGVVRGRLLKRYDRVVAISDHMRRRMLDLGIPDDRITTVHLGLDAPAYRKRVHRSPAEVRAEFGVPGDRVLAVMVGNVRRWKGQHVILAGLAEMAPAVRNRLRVLFVGAAAPSDAGYEAGLRQTVRERGLEDVVRFVGGRQDVPDLVNAADICLHASVIPEPFGLVVLEAMALSRPLIAAASGGPAEILTPDSGILFDTEQPAQLAGALTRLVEDAELRERMGKAAARRVEEFSLLRNLRGNVQVYREVLGLA